MSTSKKSKKSHPAVKILEKHKKYVWPEIKDSLHDPSYPNEFKVPSNYKPEVNSHWKIIKEYPNRQGKYIRATLLMLTCEAMSGKRNDALKTAAAMQLSQDWLLIHDDIEDRSLKRRGGKTLHRAYSTEHAINAGDTLQVIMWKTLFENEPILGTKKTHKLIDEFYKILTRTVLGQTVEIIWVEKEKTNLSDKDWFFIGDGKTSYYTIAGPMRLGAIIAGATNAQLNLLAKFGLYLGRCFQLVDDILDLTSDFKGLKKQTGNDIYEGKRTLLLGHLLRTAKSKDKKKIISILKKTREQKTTQEVKWVIDKMHQYKSIEYAKKIAKVHKEKAKEIFDKDLKFLSKQPARKHLEQLIEFISEREY